MNQLFRCPGCKEVIRTDQPVCQYCNSSIDGTTAQAESLKFQAGIDACASANHIKSLNYAAPFLLLTDAIFLLTGMGDEFFSKPRVQMFISLLPFGLLTGAFGWFTKYGGLQTDDPDFPEARQAVKKALILWIILSVVHAAVLAKIFL